MSTPSPDTSPLPGTTPDLSHADVHGYSKKSFHWVDYIVFTITLCISACIGIYFGFISKRKQRDNRDYLLAGKQMGTVPVAMSLLASFLSAISLLGTPAEVYTYGTMYWMIGIAYVIIVFLAAFFYLPRFYKLNITSVYEFLEWKFNYPTRLLACITFIVQMTIYMALVLYAPALALNAVTNLNVWLSVLSIGVVCTFYTSVGGMKAVIWTDVFQFTLMVIGMLMVVIEGSIIVGGFDEVWRINDDSGRVQFFNLDPNPLTRHTLWSLAVGGIFTWLGIYGVNQTQVQRYLTVSTLRQAQIALILNAPGLLLIMLLSAVSGMVIYAVYAKCDPILSGHITQKDQLLPFFVMESFSFFPGLAGIFLAGVMSGALSTVSSGVNALAAVTIEDIGMKIPFIRNMSEERRTTVSKFIAFAYGVISILLTFICDQLGGILQAALAVFGMTAGPLLGIFTLGFFFPWSNKWGGFFGLLGGTLMSFWVGFGEAIYKSQYEKMPISSEGCDAMYGANGTTLLNQTRRVMLSHQHNDTWNSVSHTTTPGAINNDNIFILYRMSYLWISAWGCLWVLIIGMVVSLLTGGCKQEGDRSALYEERGVPLATFDEYDDVKEMPAGTYKPTTEELLHKEK